MASAGEKKRDYIGMAAWAFEVFTAVLSVVDVLSDVLVAQQFWSDDHRGWAWMVVLSLIVSNCIYAVMAQNMLLNDRWKILDSGSKMDTICSFCICFPFAQFFPLVQWFCEVRDQMRTGDQSKKTDDYSVEDSDDDLAYQTLQGNNRASQEEDRGMGPREDSWEGKARSRAAQEELLEDMELRQFVHRMHKSFEQHMKANCGFYVETLVEAIPQAVIQLIAVSALGNATELQLLSMCLSLVSIVSKAYVVCVTFDIRAMLFKASLIAFDVFSLFHLFATVLAKDEPVEDTVYMAVPSGLGVLTAVESVIPGVAWVPLPVSALAASWFSWFFYLVSAAALSLIGIGLVILAIETYNRRPLKPFDAFAISGGIVAAFFPAVLALTGAKLAFLLIPLLALLPPTSSMPFYAISFAFYRRGLKRGLAEGFERLKHTLHFVVDYGLKASRAAAATRAQQAAMRRPARRNRVQVQPCGEPWSEFMARSLHRLIDSGAIQMWSYRRPKQESPAPAAPQLPWKDIVAQAAHRMYQHALTRWRTSTWKQRAEAAGAIFGFIWFAHLFLAYVIFVFVNLAFPFRHALAYGIAHQNVLQLTCLVCCAASVTVLVSLTPFMYRFINFTFIVREMRDAMGEGPRTAGDAARLVEDYHKPPHVAVLKAAIEARALPHDLCEVMAAYMTVDDLDLTALSADECAMLRDHEARE